MPIFLFFFLVRFIFYQKVIIYLFVSISGVMSLYLYFQEDHYTKPFINTTAISIYTVYYHMIKNYYSKILDLPFLLEYINDAYYNNRHNKFQSQGMSVVLVIAFFLDYIINFYAFLLLVVLFNHYHAKFYHFYLTSINQNNLFTKY